MNKESIKLYIKQSPHPTHFKTELRDDTESESSQSSENPFEFNLSVKSESVDSSPVKLSPGYFVQQEPPILHPIAFLSQSSSNLSSSVYTMARRPKSSPDASCQIVSDIRRSGRKRKCVKQEKRHRSHRNSTRIKRRHRVDDESSEDDFKNSDDTRVWLCPVCKTEDDGNLMIACDICLEWYHCQCLDIASEPIENEWYCPSCTSNPPRSNSCPTVSSSADRRNTTSLPHIYYPITDQSAPINGSASSSESLGPPTLSPNPPLSQASIGSATPVVGSTDNHIHVANGTGPSVENSERNENEPGKSESSTAQTQSRVEYVHCEDSDYYRIWLCPICATEDDGSLMIGCDNCDDWYHGRCVSITSGPKEEKWYCPTCKASQSSATNATSVNLATTDISSMLGTVEAGQQMPQTLILTPDKSFGSIANKTEVFIYSLTRHLILDNVPTESSASDHWVNASASQSIASTSSIDSLSLASRSPQNSPKQEPPNTCQVTNAPEDKTRECRDEEEEKQLDQLNATPRQSRLRVDDVYSHDGSVDSYGDRIYLCPLCRTDYDEYRHMIGCDICNDWYHCECMGMPGLPESNDWICPTCVDRGSIFSFSSGDTSSDMDIG